MVGKCKTSSWLTGVETYQNLKGLDRVANASLNSGSYSPVKYYTVNELFNIICNLSKSCSNIMGLSNMHLLTSHANNCSLC